MAQCRHTVATEQAGYFPSANSTTRARTFENSLKILRRLHDKLDRFVRTSQFFDQPVELTVLSACERAEGDERAAKFMPVFALQMTQTLPSITAHQVEYDNGVTTMILYLSRNADEPPHDDSWSKYRRQR